ncbi:NAD(+) diphosphatase [Marinomonas mediterranea]|jgi:NTP pyrophosphohydrolases containing a Zn-finger, probably nucleic-acid-binding|uniref:NAD(+) diphosphatase n=1 Tax=Marinomonas mediterranea (strain ATCC 700492 / JCM 21426 / NBRC 103028 / MMB-1) TaxID=717774 RepID=F2K1U4_MARM1|nr:NAD(+) diphosphatase [Marinomonas mediterranea]ADZ89938.1 NAD(+) diphosphatase [Marinomonas mediterranea MMB-1]WCN12112.1 NAD(+) diphosphatase [Marinomonas mediterranea]WCN16149.1 NAD(+) diphosphatase [Marinomonas mediterranea MMB-1]
MLTIGIDKHPKPHTQAQYILLYDNQVIVAGHSFLFSLDDFQPDKEASPVFCGTWQEKDIFICILNKKPTGLESISLRELLFRENEDNFLILSRAQQLAHWDRDHQFCGRCGTEMTTKHEREHTKICPSCNLRHYPRISPCIIVSIRKGNTLLLARAPHMKEGMYSNIAGFVEAGEPLEEAVHREVFEEVGIRVKNIEYIGSQPWSFPHQLMVGFYAEYESGDITPAEGEIESADWFSISELPITPNLSSISGQLIQSHCDRIQGNEAT